MHMLMLCLCKCKCKVTPGCYSFNDGEVLERSGQLGQPIATARPDGVPPVCVGFWVSRDFTDILAYRAPSKAPSGDVSCISRSPPGAHIDVFMCEQCR
jgi:hypothetical protein